MSNLLPLMIAVPLTAGFVLALMPRKNQRLCSAIACTVSTVLLFMVLALFGRSEVYHVGGWQAPVGINLSLDGLSWLMLLMIALTSSATILFSFAYMENYTSKKRYYCLFMLMLAGMNGTALSGDIFNRFVYVEIAIIASYILVGFGCAAEELEAALKYAVLGAIASAMTLFGIAILYALHGTLNIAHLAEKISVGAPVSASATSAFFAAVVMLVGFTYKAAAAPLHIWQPDAFSAAPATVSAALSGALIQVVGIYAMIRTMFIVFGVNASIGWIFLGLGMLSMLFGTTAGMKQDELRRMLSYHCIAQIGHILAGLGLGSILIARGTNESAATLALVGAIFHMVNHAVYQPLLFLSTGAIEHATGLRDIAGLSGFSRRKNAASFASLIASCSIAGLPPFGGFFSKLLIIIASVMAGYYAIAVAMAAVGIATLAAFMHLQYKLFFGNACDESETAKSTPRSMKGSMVALAAICMVSSLLALPDIRAAILDPAQEAMVDREGYMQHLRNQSCEDLERIDDESGVEK